MDTIRNCKQCRQPLPGNAPEGLCPQCLAKVGLGSEPAAPGTRLAPDIAQLAPQFPQLEILELLGMGGMGMVYRARQPRLDRMVALKILSVESAQQPSFAERFSREAKALAKLNHPGIVAVYDFGQSGQYYYFVMEYVDGINLRGCLNNQTVTPRQALELVVQICTALQYAHDEGVVHRDIKPENILITKKGQVKIADFGLAKLLGTAPDTALTGSQAGMGTTNYMAPEQRQNAHDVDHRADIYSLGVVFYEMLTGEVPMGRFDAPSKKVDIDVRLDEVVLRALEREPSRRYQHVTEVKTDVETITSTLPREETATGAPEASKPQPRPGFGFPLKTVSLIAGLAAILAVAVLITQPFSRRQGVPSQALSNSAQHRPAAAIPAGPMPPGLSAAERTVVLKAANFMPIGESEERKLGYVATGPVFGSNPAALRVDIDKSLAGHLEITRLYYCRKHAIPDPGNPRWVMARYVRAWVPELGGTFCRATVVDDANASLPGITVKPAKRLLDGVYCIHVGDIQRINKEQPAFAASFVVGGIAELSIAEKGATFEKDRARLALALTNSGAGEFNRGCITITLQRVNPEKGQSEFSGRWNEDLPSVPAHGIAKYDKEFPTSGWIPGRYYFYGHVQSIGSTSDDDNIEDFETEHFAVSKTERAPTAAVPVPAEPRSVGRAGGSFTLFAPGVPGAEMRALQSILAGEGGPESVNLVSSLAEGIRATNSVLVLLLDDDGYSKTGTYSAKALKLKRVLGIGYGAARVFGELGLKISAGNCAHGTGGEPTLLIQTNRLIPVDLIDHAFTIFVPPILDPTNLHNDIIFGVYIGDKHPEIRPGLDVVAIYANQRDYTPVVRQDGFVLVGVNAHVLNWSPSFGTLVRELGRALARSTGLDSPAQR